MFEYSKKISGSSDLNGRFGFARKFYLSRTAAGRLANCQDEAQTGAGRLPICQSPCVWLETSQVDNENEIPVGATKIGGRPDLPSTYEWPQRLAYADAAQRSADYVEESERLNEWWSWATPEQCDEFRRDTKQMAQIIKVPFALQFIAQDQSGRGLGGRGY